MGEENSPRRHEGHEDEFSPTIFERLNLVVGMLVPQGIQDRAFHTFCTACGWHGSSHDCGGGTAIADTGDYSELTCPKCFAETGDSEEVTEFLEALHRRAKAIMEGTPWPIRKCKDCDVLITDFSRWAIDGPLCVVCNEAQCTYFDVRGDMVAKGTPPPGAPE